MYCNNCGTEITKDAEFCPNCGKKIDKNKLETVAKPASKTSVKSASKWKIITGLILVIAVLLGGFYGYRLLYYPKVVKSAITENGFTISGYSAQANVLKKTVVIKANRAKVYNLVAASTTNGFSTAPIGAESQLAGLEKDLPGDWTVQIIQDVDEKSPRVMWEISGGRESVRYQNSDEFKKAKQAYIEENREKEASDSEFDSAVTGSSSRRVNRICLRSLEYRGILICLVQNVVTKLKEI